ncbi:MAG: hypothetical protein WCT39_06110 [Candidatus Margulisiibacteriota bacterium]
MPSEYCPKCKTIRNLRASIVIKKTKDKRGKIKETAVTSYHCEECNSFIKSEEKKTRTKSINDLLDY